MVRKFIHSICCKMYMHEFHFTEIGNLFVSILRSVNFSCYFLICKQKFWFQKRKHSQLSLKCSRVHIEMNYEKFKRSDWPVRSGRCGQCVRPIKHLPDLHFFYNFNWITHILAKSIKWFVYSFKWYLGILKVTYCLTNRKEISTALKLPCNFEESPPYFATYKVAPYYQ
jgi:hypothetical protein